MRRTTISGARGGVVPRLVIGTTAVATVLALGVQTSVVAAPAPEERQAAFATAVGTTEAQRVDAAAVVGLDPTPDVLLLSDYDFVHALWRKAGEAGERRESVRTAAERAMVGAVAADLVTFVVTGIHEANRQDQQRERDKAEAERVARLARQQVLTVIGITPTPELLALSDDNFVRAVLRHAASGPEVRAAAAKALAEDQAAWREFIVNGAREAHRRDVARELEEIAERDRKEAELRKNQAARKNVAALFRVSMTQGLLDVSDDNFLREMLRQAPADLKGSELHSAAQRALLSPKPADWLDFLLTGADAAYKRDDEARRKKIAAANRLLTQQMQDAAEKTGVNPNLVAAAKKALAAGDERISDFLKEENQKRFRRQSLQILLPANGVEGWFARYSSADHGLGFLTPIDSRSPQRDREEATWAIVPALSGRAGCHSLEAATKPGHYLSGRPGSALRVAVDDRTPDFRNSATWCTDGGDRVLWKSAIDPNQYLDYNAGQLVTAPIVMMRNAVWRITPPLAP
ncbi:AbfB domain-containing protein [Streptomyces sp. NPDC048606]|uniref:AbfB domain-containing protein n=1 Tax=Streptomyces sp. NPDC048606 TaxID=3154726 RepID=UPI003434718F